MELELNVDDISTAHKAAVRGNKDELENVLNVEPSLRDSIDYFGRTPLMYCVLADRLNTAKYLIRQGAQVSCVDNHGRSAVHIAAHKGAIKFLQLLAEKGANFSLPDKEGQTPLHLATNRRNQDGACVRYILKKIEPNYIDARNHQGQSALHCAAYFANVEAVRLLTKSNANPDLGDINGKTPLHFSASNCQANAAKTVDLLLTLGSSTLINWQDYEGRTALHTAIKEANKLVADLLITRNADVKLADNKSRTALHWAAQLGRVEFIKTLLDGKVDAQALDSNGATPLHYAAAAGTTTSHCSTIAILLDHGVSVDIQDETGSTPLIWASSKGASNAIVKLIESGAEIQQSNHTGNTALHGASTAGKSLAVEILISRGADCESENHSGQSPIFGATKSGNLSTVKALCERLPITGFIHQDHNGSTPLHFAAEYGHADVIEYIIRLAQSKKIRPIIDISDQSGKTALHLASENGKTNSMAALLEWGADVDTQDAAGWSALHSAAGNNQMAAAKLLIQYHAFINPMDYSTNRETPLNCAYNNNAEAIVNFLIAHDALTGDGLKHLAATRIQINWRIFIKRKKLQKQNFLFSKAEYLRRDAAEIRRIRIASQSKMDDNVSPPDRNTRPPPIQKPPNPFTVSTGTQTETKRLKTHSTQTSKRMAKQTMIECHCFPRVPSPSPLDECKLYEYGGESAENFIDSCHGLSGMRYKVKRQIATRAEQNKRARLAATTIQSWWRRKKNMQLTCQNADGVSKTTVKTYTKKKILKKIKSSKIHPKHTKISNSLIDSKLIDSKLDSQTDSKSNPPLIKSEPLPTRAGRSKKSRKRSEINLAVTSEDIRAGKMIAKTFRTASTHSTVSESVTKSSIVSTHSRTRRRKQNRIQPAFWPLTMKDIYGNPFKQ